VKIGWFRSNVLWRMGVGVCFFCRRGYISKVS
jgi:hypothetical protein